LGLGAPAGAHEFTCEQSVDGAPLREVSRYPATLRFHFTVTNSHPSATSQAQGVEDALLAPQGFHFTPAAPFSLAAGQSVGGDFELTLRDEAECLALAAADGTEDRFIDNRLVVTWDTGSAVCSARAVCKATGAPPAPECQPGQGATRGLGFWKTHVDAASVCLAAGPIDVGLARLTTMADVEGLLWGSPAKFANSTKRGALDTQRFLLARELLVATCNVRVLGAVPSSPELLSGAQAALQGTDCAALAAYEERLTHFQECGQDAATPAFGKADPGHAQSLARDATAPSSESCSPPGGSPGGR
jgi:hypothetical protein